MVRLLVKWILSAVLLLIVAHFVPGFMVTSFTAALIAAVVIGLVNGTLGVFLKIVTLPLTFLTFGIFLLFINALMLMVASAIVPGFHVAGFLPAFWGGVLLSILHLLVHWLMPKKRED
jgi:putative membrane protein